MYGNYNAFIARTGKEFGNLFIKKKILSKIIN